MPYKPRADRLLTQQQERFAHEYLVDCDPQAAAVRAGYSSGPALKVTPYRLLADPRIQDIIQARRRALIAKTELTQERVVEELRRIALFNVRDVVTWDGQRLEVRPLDELPESITAAISELAIDVEELELEQGPSAEDRALVDLGVIAEAPPKKAGRILRKKIRLKTHSKLDALAQAAKILGFEKEKAPTTAVGVQIFFGGGTTGLEAGSVTARAGAVLANGEVRQLPPPALEIGGA